MQVLVDANVPAPQILQISELVIGARAAQAEGRLRRQPPQLLRQAIVLEDAIPYTEPPYWYYPIRQTLGAVLLQAGETERGGAGVPRGAGPQPEQRLGALRSEGSLRQGRRPVRGVGDARALPQGLGGRGGSGDQPDLSRSINAMAAVGLRTLWPLMT